MVAKPPARLRETPKQGYERSPPGAAQLVWLMAWTQVPGPPPIGTIMVPGGPIPMKLSHQAAAEILLPRRHCRQVMVNERALDKVVPHQRLACQTKVPPRRSAMKQVSVPD